MKRPGLGLYVLVLLTVVVAGEISLAVRRRADRLRQDEQELVDYRWIDSGAARPDSPIYLRYSNGVSIPVARVRQPGVDTLGADSLWDAALGWAPWYSSLPSYRIRPFGAPLNGGHWQERPR